MNPVYSIFHFPQQSFPAHIKSFQYRCASINVVNKIQSYFDSMIGELKYPSGKNYMETFNL